jgi:hypothetical protein
MSRRYEFAIDRTPTSRTTDLHYGSVTVNTNDILGELVNDRRRSLMAEATAHRASRSLRPDRGTSAPGPVRRAIGTRLIRFGEALTQPADPAVARA